VSGLDRTVPEIVASARMGEGQAAAYLDRWLDRVSRSLATLLNIIDPDVVVFGGGLSNIDELYHELSERVAVYTIGPVARTTFVRARHGDSSGVRGAAWLGREPVR
jgi:fructokinase